MYRRVSRFHPCVWAHPVSTPQQPICFHQVRNQQIWQLTNSWGVNSERSARFTGEPLAENWLPIFLALGLAAPARITAWTTCFPPTVLGVESAVCNRNHCCLAVLVLAPPIADSVPAGLTFLDRLRCALTAFKANDDDKNSGSRSRKKKRLHTSRWLLSNVCCKVKETEQPKSCRSAKMD